MHLLNAKASSTISLLLNLVEREGLPFNKEMMKKSESMPEEHGIKLIEISYKNKKYETIESILRDNHII